MQNYYLFISYILLVGFSKIYASVRQKLFPFVVPFKLLIKLNLFVFICDFFLFSFKFYYKSSIIISFKYYYYVNRNWYQKLVEFCLF